jgi:luciferase family oxidoreductase group 1
MRLSILDQSPVPSGVAPADALANTLDLARFADRLGYTRYWLAEHHGMEAFASPVPEILIARIAAETTGIRVGSGGVLLPHYSPFKVAETFRMLHALYPQRIDLGVGRGPGTSPVQARALLRSTDHSTSPDFAERLVELLAFLEGAFPLDHEFSGIKVSPRSPSGPSVWLLGSSLRSATLAARNGLAHAIGHFVNPAPTAEVVDHYRLTFQPLRQEREPRAIVALAALCADTEAEARRLSQSAHFLSRFGGDNRTVPTPDEAAAELGNFADHRLDGASEGADWNYIVGAPEQLRDKLTKIASHFGIDELMIVTIVHDHCARRRSYQLLAEAFDLAGARLPSAHGVNIMCQVPRR